MASTFTKDPDAVLDYAFDWATNWLATGETISSETVTASTGLTVVSTTENAGTVTTWLSGGTASTAYTVTCQIVTSAGRTDDRSIIVVVQER